MSIFKRFNRKKTIEDDDQYQWTVKFVEWEDRVSDKQLLDIMQMFGLVDTRINGYSVLVRDIYDTIFGRNNEFVRELRNVVGRESIMSTETRMWYNVVGKTLSKDPRGFKGKYTTLYEMMRDIRRDEVVMEYLFDKYQNPL